MSGAIPCWTCQLPHYIGGAAKWGSWQVQQGMAPLMLCPYNKVSVFTALYFILLRFIYGRYDLLQLSDWNYVRAADGNGILLINAAGSV